MNALIAFAASAERFKQLIGKCQRLEAYWPARLSEHRCSSPRGQDSQPVGYGMMYENATKVGKKY